MTFHPSSRQCVAALLVALCTPWPALAQAPRTLPVQAERRAAELKQGMSPDEVRNLLGTPDRIERRTDGNSVSDATRGTQHWTYTYDATSSAPGTLRIDFGSRRAETWGVTRWQWAGP